MSVSGRRLLVVAGGPRATASVRHRLLCYRPFLERDGVAIDWIEYSGGRIASRAAALAARARFLFDLGRRVGVRDTVLVQKVLPPIGLVRRWRSAGCRVVYDFDDALFERFQWGESEEQAARRRRRFDAMIAASTEVIAGSPPLAAYVRAGGRPVTVVFPALERERFRDLPPRKSSGGTVIGWVGNDQSQVYLKALEPILARALAAHPAARLRVCSSSLPALPTLPADRVEFVPWSERGELEAVASFDLAVSPLADDRWSRARGGRVSVLLSLAAGVPVIAAPGGGLEELVREGRRTDPGIVLADGDAAWAEHLDRLLANPEERARRALAALALIDERIWADVQYPTFRRAVLG